MYNGFPKLLSYSVNQTRRRVAIAKGCLNKESQLDFHVGACMFAPWLDHWVLKKQRESREELADFVMSRTNSKEKRKGKELNLSV